MKKLLLLLLVFTLGYVNGQTDIGLWTHISIEKEIVNYLEFGLEEELRLSDEFRKFDRILTNLSLEYKVNKYYKPGIAYRFSYFEGSEMSSRFSLYNKLDYKIKSIDLEIDYRLLFHVDIFTSTPTRYRLRNKIGLTYDINKKWDIGMTYELFYSFYYDRNVLDRQRFSWGFDYKIKKRQRIDFKLIFQNELNTANPDKDVIFSTGYKYTFK